MANATHLTAETAAPARVGDAASAPVLAYVIVCAVPALFWTALAAVTGWIFDAAVPLVPLAGAGLLIAGFLAVVFSALIQARRGS
jgi:hypothetical protein